MRDARRAMPGSAALRAVLLLLPLLLALSAPRTLADERRRAEVAPERITDGYDAWLSPDGRHLAYRRTVFDEATRDWRGQPVTHGWLHLHDLASGAERRAARNGTVTGWAGGRFVVLHDGSSLRLDGTGDGPLFPRAPEGLHTPAWTRSRDGRRVAWTVRGTTMQDMSPLTAPEGRKHTIYLAEGDTSPRPLDLGAYVNHERASGLLAFSPGGRRLAFRLGFMHQGQLPHPRIGVFDTATDTCTFLADEASGSRGQGDAPSPTGASAWAAWDATGSRFVFVKTSGPRQRDVYTATADGRDVRRLTVDGAWKACPCLDPAGERCAYWVRDESRLEERASGELLRVVLLRTGDVVPVPTPSFGHGRDLQWTPDGAHLVFTWRGADGAGIWRIPAPPAPDVASGTPVVDRTRSALEELLAELASDDEHLVEEAIRRTWRQPHPRVTTALIEVLERWVRTPNSRPPWDLLRALQHRNAIGATPALLDALPKETWTTQVTPLLLAWDVDAGLPAWRRLSEAHDPRARGWARAACARFEDEGAWERVRETAHDEDADARDAVLSGLAFVPDARSVDLLIAHLDDEGFLYTADERVVVGMHAAKSLERLTGLDFGRNATAWTAWWDGVGRNLPPRREEER